jgi:hypothetical protein
MALQEAGAVRERTHVHSRHPVQRMVGTYHGDERLQGQDLVVEAVWDLVAEQPDKGGVDMAGRDRRDGGQAAFV